MSSTTPKKQARKRLSAKIQVTAFLCLGVIALAINTPPSKVEGPITVTELDRAISAGEFRRAESVATELIKLGKNRVYALARRGEARIFTDNTIGGFRDYDKAIALEPSNPYPYLARGHALSHLRNFKEARWYISEARRLSDDTPSSIYEDISEKIRSGKEAEAAKLSEEMVLKFPKDRNAQYIRARALYFARNSEKALHHIQTATALSPNSIRIWLQHGDIQKSLGNYSDAISAYNHAIKLGSKHWYTIYQRARTNLLNGDISAAQSDITTALEMSPRCQFLIRFSVRLKQLPKSPSPQQLRHVHGSGIIFSFYAIDCTTNF